MAKIVPRVDQKLRQKLETVAHNFFQGPIGNPCSNSDFRCALTLILETVAKIVPRVEKKLRQKLETVAHNFFQEPLEQKKLI